MARKRERSPDDEDEDATHAHGDGGGKRHNLSVPICKDFRRGRCSRPIAQCRYAHPPHTVAVDGDQQVTICYDSLRNRCGRGLSCRYFHPPPHIRVPMQEALGIEPMPLGPELKPSNLVLASVEVCRDYVRGRCKRDARDCRFAHHAPTLADGELAVVCQDYMRAKCERDACRYFHPPEHLRSRQLGPTPSRPDPVSVSTSLAYEYQHQAKRLRLEQQCHDNALQISDGTALRPSSPAAGNDQAKLPVCRDFLRNKCTRNHACRFAHPGPLAQVVDGCVTLCRDSLRGKCRRETCIYHHPSIPSQKATASKAADVDTEDEFGTGRD